MLWQTTILNFSEIPEPPSTWRIIPGVSKWLIIMVPKSRKACGAVSSLSIHGLFLALHPRRFSWNLQITRLERNMIFQTSMIMFHVNLQGCSAKWGVILITYFILGAHPPSVKITSGTMRSVRWFFGPHVTFAWPNIFRRYGTVLGTNKPFKSCRVFRPVYYVRDQHPAREMAAKDVYLHFWYLKLLVNTGWGSTPKSCAGHRSGARLIALHLNGSCRFRVFGSAFAWSFTWGDAYRCYIAIKHMMHDDGLYISLYHIKCNYTFNIFQYIM